MRSKSKTALFATMIVGAGTVAAIDGCRPRGNDASVTDAAATDAAPGVTADPDAPSTATPTTSASVVAPPAVDVPCSVAAASYPAGGGPAVGEDLSRAPVPMRVPEGASLTIAVRATGHLVLVKGPAVLRACTADDPEVVLLANGFVSTDVAAPVRPGAELFVATPAFVAIVPRATLRVRASAANATWEVDEGEVTITNLDQPKLAVGKDRGSLKRYEEGGVLVTRCGVQAAAAATAERMLRNLELGDATAPLPSASVGILTVRRTKLARERVLDCAFAEAYALSCDWLSGEADAAVAGCASGGYLRVREHVAKAVASGPIPPGPPPPKPSASP